MTDQPVSNTASGLLEFPLVDFIARANAGISIEAGDALTSDEVKFAFIKGARQGWDARDEEVQRLTADWQKEHTAKVDAKVDLDRLETENKRLREALEAARPWLKMALDSDYFEAHGNLKRAVCLVKEVLALKDSGR